MKLSFVFQLLLLLPLTTLSQTATPYKERMGGILKKKTLNENSLVSQIPFRNIGPTVMSGRVVDMDVNPQDPTNFYVAFASGGLWRTTNNGTSFEPLFDKETVITIGDIAVDWKNGETIWIGTGESNSSRSSYSGVGVYVSRDKGKSWEHKGLEETHHIGKVIIHPTDPNTIYVGAIGHLYTPNPDRGVFKTSDGGKTWKKVLFVDVNTGVIDMIIDPKDPKNLYASSWQRSRSAWNFEEAGAKSAIYKSIDGGDTWAVCSGGTSGFPSGTGMGRIGLAVSSSNPTIVYALLDNQFPRAEEKKEPKNEITKDQLRVITNDEFLKLNDEKLDEFLRSKDFPEKHSAASVKESVKNGKIKPSALVEFLEDANTLLFETKVTGAELYRSDDAGKTWKKTHEGYMDGMYHTYGYYFGKVEVSPVNPESVYLIGFVILHSNDGGKTFSSLNRDNTHVDYHSLWIDPLKPDHLICGNDGGLNISYDNGKTWVKCNSLAVGQFYAINYDMATPYNVYGGLQDNGVWTGSSNYTYSPGWYQEGEYPYKNLMGGDGMQVMIDPRDNNTVYTGYQFGNYFRINKTTREPVYITPQHELGERPYRWNWESPIWLSIHNPDILYMGSNRFHRSFNKGKEFKTLSGDLTAGGKKGDVTYGTLTSIHESPLKFGLIYTGSDDGLVHVTKDGGYTWTRITSGLPANMWVSQVWASSHKESRVYCSLNGLRWDHFASYVYVSEDFGSSWKRIANDLPMEPVNVVKEDPSNEKVIYVGTDNGLYVSLNGGVSCMSLMKDLPNVAVHDLAIHPRDKEIIVGTHGRSIYIADVSLIQQLKDSVLAKDYYLFATKNVKWRKGWGNKGAIYDEPSVPETKFAFYSGIKSTITWELKADSTLVLFQKTQTCGKGINYLSYDLSIEEKIKEAYEAFLNKNRPKDSDPLKLEIGDNGKYYLQPGKYKLMITDMSTGKVQQTSFEVLKPKGMH